MSEGQSPGPEVGGSSDPYDFGIADFEAFMTEYRYNICHIVEVEKAFPWLRHRGVLDESDQQLIMNEYRTSYLRTGHMVDLLVRRGKKGCEALLEHLEDDYPEHFEMLTHKKPRKPNPCSEYKSLVPDVEEPGRRTSLIVLRQISTLNQKIMESYLVAKLKKDSMQEDISQLKSQIDDFQREVDMKSDQIHELSRKNLELKDQCKHSQLNCDLERHEKVLYMEECNRMRKAKDEAQDKCNQIWTERRVAVRAVVTSLSDQTISKLQQENALLHQELDNFKHRNPKTLDDCTNDTIKRQTSEIDKLKEETQKLRDERGDLLKQIDNLYQMSRVYETNTEELKSQLEQSKLERDKGWASFKECREKCESLQTLNAELKIQVSDKKTDLNLMKYEAKAVRPSRPVVRFRQLALALFAPRQIQNELVKKIQDSDSFVQCPSANFLDSNLEKDEQSYDVHKLERIIQEYKDLEKGGRFILLCIPPDVIRLLQHIITFHVVVVKYDDEGDKNNGQPLTTDLQCHKITVSRDTELESIVRKIKIKLFAINTSHQIDYNRTSIG